MSKKRVSAIALVSAAIVVGAITLSLTWSRGTGSLGSAAGGNKDQTSGASSLQAGARAQGSTEAGSPASTSNDGLGQPAHPNWPPPAASPHPNTDNVLAYPYHFVGPGR
jgi:hypothetical protein